MQMNVGLTGKTVVAGLNWSIVPKSGPGRKKDIRKACVDSGFTFGVTVNGTEHGSLGLCVKKAEYPSGAAMLAAANAAAIKTRDFGDSQSNANWILVEKLKSGERAGQYWMCAISDGVPVPGTDIIEDLTVTSARLAELVEILENVDIFSIEQEILEYVAGASPSFEKGFADLTAGIAVSKVYRPQKIIGVPDWFYMMLFGVCTLAVSIVGYTVWDEAQQQDAKRRQLDISKAKAEQDKLEDATRQTNAYKRADETARQTEIDKVAKAIGADPASLMTTWSATINSLPINNGGWNMDSANCNTQSCTITLTRDESIGTNASLKELVPNVEFLDAGTASYTVPVHESARRNVDLRELSAWPDFALGVGSRLQELRMTGLVEAKIGVRQELTYRPPNLTAPAGGGVLDTAKAALGTAPAAGGAQAVRPIGLMSGSLSIHGTSIWQMEYVYDYLKSKEFVVDTLRVDFARTISSDSSWTVNGSYYLKSGAVPLAAQVSGPTLGKLTQVGGPVPPANQPLPVSVAK